ncbi:helix-turn-helix domain-containing protein [Streptomyces sp. NPDC048171]|uniref:helix-turn-helix domain-containing protein n=1 Tax=unclassified Streptomyces TaxID=2593676 RepID=UPI00372089F1
MTLELAGLSTTEESVYRALVAAGRISLADLSQRTKLRPSALKATLAALMSQGLVGSPDSSPGVYHATPPDVALTPRINRHAEALDAARAAVAGLVDVHRSIAARQDTSHLIQFVTGAEALRHHLRHIQSAARDEMLWFCKPQYVAMQAGTNEAEFEALARGVRYRVLYERAYFDDEGAVGHVARAVRAGELARAVPHLPLRLAIADRTLAVCPLAVEGGSESTPPPLTALIRDGHLVAALIALFERCWQDAVPLPVDRSGTVTEAHTAQGGLSASDRQLLSLLVAGVADKAIVTQTGLSRRTVQRRVQGMMKLAGATTRTQLAWQAAHRGWL